MNILIDTQKALEVILREKHASESSELDFIEWLRYKGIELHVPVAKTIKQIVCDIHAVEDNKVFAEDMPRQYSEIRHITAYFYIKMFDHKNGKIKHLLSTADVGKLIGTSRQNIEKAYNRIKGLYEVEDKFRQKLDRIEQTIYDYLRNNTLKFS